MSRSKVTLPRLLKAVEVLAFFLWSALYGAVALLSHLHSVEALEQTQYEGLRFRFWLAAGPLMLSWGILNWTRRARERRAKETAEK
jgi:hypothetical protein